MILIDYRENRSMVPRWLQKFRVPVQIADLAVDYMIGKNCFVERKTVDDFIASISDKRIFKQVCHLREICANPLIILEGDMSLIKSRINANSIRGVALWISLQKRVPIIQTRNEYTTACILRLLAKKYGNDSYTTIKTFPRKQKVKSFWQQQMDILTQIPGIGRQTAKDLLISYGSIANMMKSPDSELINRPHIGKERLESIRHIFPHTAQ